MTTNNKSNYNLGFLLFFILLGLYFLLPVDFFYSPKGYAKDAENGGDGYSVNATDIRMKYHAVNEMGLIISKVEGFENSEQRIENQANRAEKFVNNLTANVKVAVTQKHNGVSALDVVTSPPNVAMHKFSQALNGGTSDNKVTQEFDKNLNKGWNNLNDLPPDNRTDLNAELQ